MRRLALFAACVLASSPLLAQDSGFTPEQEVWIVRAIETALGNRQVHRAESTMIGAGLATENPVESATIAPPAEQVDGAPATVEPVLVDPVKAEEGWRAGYTPNGWRARNKPFVPGDLPTSGRVSAEKTVDENARMQTTIDAVALAQASYTDAVAYAPAGRAALGAPAPQGTSINHAQFDVTFDKENSVAALVLSRIDPLLQQETTMIKRSWVVTLSAPIDADNGDARFIASDGLSHAFGAKLERRWQRQDIAFVRKPEFANALYELCDSAGMKAACSLGALEEKSGGKDDDLARRFREFTRAYIPWMWDFGVNIEGQRVRSEYLTPQLARNTRRDAQWNAGLDMVAITPSRRNAFAFGAAYGHDLKAGDVAILCPPSNGTDPVRCVSGPLGAPEESAGFKVSAEARGQFHRLGYSLRLEHNLATDRDTVDLPIYFLRNAEGALMGGLRFGWSSDAGSDVAVFVSAPFSF